jgi:3-dehydroquinate dehydratase/shikimate dehydrogenase
MTLIAVPIMVRAADEAGMALHRAQAAAKAGARLIEWRIDALAEEADSLASIRRLAAESLLPCIVTCRLAKEGGEYHGDEQTRISLFEALATEPQGPRYLDVELAAFKSSANLRQKVLLAVDHDQQPRDVKTSLILSTHDFRGRPADLLQRIEAMVAEPACAAMKIAWQARSLRDNLEAFDLLRERRKPMIALCMGNFGLMSRVLAPKFGGFLTFASDQPTTVTAPGQPTIDELRGLYRFERIGHETKVYGVIGWPVEQSRSPHLHNAGFDAVGHDGVYLPLPIPGGPTEHEHFKATVGALIDHGGLDFRGASVTIPHKENLLRFAKERGGKVDALSDRIGAANTLVVNDDRSIECLNTDCPAAVDALYAGMGINQEQLSTKRVALLGAGGAARAVAVGLLDAGATVVVFNRNRERAERLVRSLSGREAASGGGKIVAGEPEELACGCFHVFINCTPLGMAGGPAPDESPLPPEVKLDDSVTVMDTVYNPARTPLIQEAESRGARVIPGMEMFVRQAALQFERWTGKAAPGELFARMMRGDAAGKPAR